MPNSRVFVQAGSQAGVFHVVSRVVDRTFRLGEREKDEMVRLMKALEASHQVETLTSCLMSNDDPPLPPAAAGAGATGSV